MEGMVEQELKVKEAMGEDRRERGRNSIGHRDSGAGGFWGFAFV